MTSFDIIRLYEREFEKATIYETRQYFEKQKFPIERLKIEGEEIPYFVIPQTLNPALPDFALRLTRTDPESGNVEGIFGVSDSVPAHLQPWWIRHEYEEFSKIGIATKGRCAEAERRVLASIPQNIRDDYITRRIEFFQNLIPFFNQSPDNYIPGDIAEAADTLKLLVLEKYLSSAKSHDLVAQKHDEPISCTAISLINALKLQGVTISPPESDELIRRVKETILPLTVEQEGAFSRKYGFVLTQTWAPDEAKTNTLTQSVEAIEQYIKAHSPVIIKVSTHLSKRDREIKPKVQILTDKPKTHRVVISAIRDNIVIIDPYKPYDPEIFSLVLEEERIRLLSWLFSVYFQTTYFEGQDVNKDSIVEKGLSIILDSNKFLNIVPFNFIQAEFRRLEKIE